jgi:type II secretory pathway component PulM
MKGLTEREQRLIALAILVGLIAAVWLGIVSPVAHGFAERRDERTAALDELARDARLVSAFRALRAEAAAERDGGPFVLRAPTLPAALQTARARIAAAVTAQGGTVQALRDQPASLQQVGVEADLRIGLAGLVEVVRRLENDRPVAAIQTLAISAAPAGADPAAPLTVRLDVSYAYAAG